MQVLETVFPQTAPFQKLLLKVLMACMVLLALNPNLAVFSEARDGAWLV